jgi:hypothetical protein
MLSLCQEVEQGWGNAIVSLGGHISKREPQIVGQRDQRGPWHADNRSTDAFGCGAAVAMEYQHTCSDGRHRGRVKSCRTDQTEGGHAVGSGRDEATPIPWHRARDMGSLNAEMLQKFQEAVCYGALCLCCHGILLLSWTVNGFEV